MQFFWKYRLTGILIPLLSILCFWMQLNGCTLHHILCDTLFPSIFLDLLPQTSAVTSQLCHPPETMPSVSLALEWKMASALIPLRLNLREPYYKYFVGSNSRALGNWYSQNRKRCQLPICSSPYWPHLTMLRVIWPGH